LDFKYERSLKKDIISSALVTNQVKDGKDAECARHLEEVDPSRVAHGQDEDDGAAGHRELASHVPEFAEVVAVE